MDALLHDGLAEVAVIVVAAIAAIVGILKWLGGLQQLLAPVASIWRLIKRRTVPTDAKQSVNTQDVKDSTINSAGRDVTNVGRDVTNVGRDVTNVGRDVIKGLSSRQLNSALNSQSKTFLREIIRLTTGNGRRQPSRRSGNRASRQHRRDLTDDKENARVDGVDRPGNEHADAETLTSGPDTHSTSPGSLADGNADDLPSISPIHASGIVVEQTETLGLGASAEELPGRGASSLPAFEERYLVNVEPVLDPPPVWHSPTPPPTSADRPNPQVHATGAESDSVMEQHSGDQAQPSATALNCNDYTEPGESAQPQSLPKLIQPGIGAESHDNAPVSSQAQELSRTDAGFGRQHFPGAGESVEPETDEDILRDGVTSDDLGIVAEVDASAPLNSSAQPNPAPAARVVDEQAILALLELYAASDVAPILRARRISIGLSPKDINYDQGWVDQLEAGIWPDVAGAEVALARRIAHYLEVVGWQPQHLRRHLADEDEHPEQEG